MRVVKEETQEHYRALLATMTAIQGREGGAEAAAPEDAAAVMVHNRALLRNKRLMLAYVCVARSLCLAVSTYACFARRSRADAARASQQRAHGAHQGAALDRRRRLAC